MVDAWFLLDAMDGIPDEQLLLTKDFLGAADDMPLIRRLSRRRWTTLLIAAVLALLLAACGYAVYRAAMSHRELRPEDERVYFFHGEQGSPNEGLHLDLNFGTCAMALHFDTEETGPLHGFRLREGAPPDPSWSFGGPTLKTVLQSYEPGGSQPEAQQRPLEQCLQDAGMSEEESEAWYYSLTFSADSLLSRPAMRIELYDAPRLNGIDLILGWPEGEATVVREETRGDLQFLETVVEVGQKDGGTEATLFLFCFDTRRQLLLSVAGAEELTDFSMLEAVAERIELYETGFVYSRDHSGQNFSVLSLAYG